MSGIEWEHEFSSGFNFLCRTVWPRANYKGGYKVAKSEKHPDGWFSWGDDRDIKIPSINTYRKRDFEYFYKDCRDEGHVFTYENEKCDKASWHEKNISPALMYFRWHLDALQD